MAIAYRAKSNVYFPVHRKELYFAAYPKLKAYGCIDCDYLQECQKARRLIMEKVDINADSADDVIMSMLPMLPFHKLAKEVRRCDYIYETTGEKISFVGETSLYYSDDDMLDVISSDYRAERLQQVLNDMPERMRLILRGRLGLDGEERTLEDLGRQFGLTRERIRQIEKKGLRKAIRHFLAIYNSYKIFCSFQFVPLRISKVRCIISHEIVESACDMIHTLKDQA